jgi:hypothetical protein
MMMTIVHYMKLEGELTRQHGSKIINVVKQNYKLNMRFNLLKKKHGFLHVVNLQIRVWY